MVGESAGIRITAPPLGRKPIKEKQSYYQKRKYRKEAAERNHIEGKSGQGKNGYSLNQVRARLKETSESWIACIFFVMNLIHLEANHFFGPVFRWITEQTENIFAQHRPYKLLYDARITYQSETLRPYNILT